MGCNGFLKLQCLLRACAWPVWSWTLAWEPVWWHYLLAHWCVPAPQPSRACAAGGKTALRGAPALPCTLRPCSGYPSAKAAAGNTWVLVCGRRDPLGVLSQAGACSDPGAEICAPSTPDVKKMSPACAAKPNSVRETCPDRQRHIPTPKEKELGFVQVPAQCSLSHCCISFISPRLLGDAHCSPLAWVTSDKLGCRRMSSSPVEGRDLCSSCLWLWEPVLAQLPLSWMFLLSLLAARPLFLPHH